MKKTGRWLALALVLSAGAAAPAHASSCDLGAPSPYVSESPTTTFVPSTGRVDMVMLFVDFPDAPAGTESAQDLYNHIVPPALPYLQAVSGGRLDLQVHPAFAWVRMPHPSTYYGFPDLTTKQNLEYMRDAVAAADAQVDFSGAEVVDVTPTQSATALNTDVTLDAGSRDSFFVADGTKVRYGSALGADLQDGDAAPFQWAADTFEHETLHTMGLPDLYATDGSEDFHRYVGSWDIMGDEYRDPSPMAWHRRRLGWLDPSQTVCVTKPRRVTTALTPLDADGGRKLVVLKYAARKAVTVEARRPVGIDAGVCGQGVLISKVNAGKASGDGPIVVQRAARSTSDDFDCGDTANAAFGPGQTFRSGRVTVKVLGTAGDGYRVRAVLAR